VTAVVHGPNYARNVQWREKKKALKARRREMGRRRSDGGVPMSRSKIGSVGAPWQRESWRSEAVSVGEEEGQQGKGAAFSLCSQEVRRRLAETRAARLIAENEAAAAMSERKLQLCGAVDVMKAAEVKLKTAKALQQCALVEAGDMEKLKKMQETKVMRATETNKVAVEKAFASLASSGNVPSLVGGHAVTIRSGSISPNSSASEAEVRKIQKDLVDMTERMERLQACLAQGDFERAKAVAAGGKVDLGEYEDSVGLTVPEGGPPSIWYADGGYIARDGRFHSMPGEYDNFQFEE